MVITNIYSNSYHQGVSENENINIIIIVIKFAIIIDIVNININIIDLLFLLLNNTFAKLL